MLLPVLPHGLALRLVEDEEADEDEEASEDERRHHALHRLVRRVELGLLARPRSLEKVEDDNSSPHMTF